MENTPKAIISYEFAVAAHNMVRLTNADYADVARFFGLSVSELDAGLARHNLTRPEFDPILSPLISKRRTAPDFCAMHVALTVVEAAIAHECDGAKRDGIVHFLGAACQAIEQVILAEYDKRRA